MAFDRDQKYIEMLRTGISEKLKQQATALRNIAAELERYAKEIDDDKNVLTVISNAQHAVLWGMANLNLDELPSRARDIQDVLDVIYAKET